LSALASVNGVDARVERQAVDEQNLSHGRTSNTSQPRQDPRILGPIPTPARPISGGSALIYLPPTVFAIGCAGRCLALDSWVSPSTRVAGRRSNRATWALVSVPGVVATPQG